MHRSKFVIWLVLVTVTVLLLPGQAASAVTQEYSFGLKPIDDSVDVYVYLNEEQWAEVVVAFSESAEPAETNVWPLTHYQYPTKTVIEAITRFTDVQYVAFALSWDNVTRMTSFLVRFIVRIFFHGEVAAEANVTVTVYGESSSSDTQTSPPDSLSQSGTILAMATAGAVSVAVLTMVVAVRMKRGRLAG